MSLRSSVLLLLLTASACNPCADVKGTCVVLELQGSASRIDLVRVTRRSDGLVRDFPDGGRREVRLPTQLVVDWTDASTPLELDLHAYRGSLLYVGYARIEPQDAKRRIDKTVELQSNCQEDSVICVEGGDCVNLGFDKDNCGACGNVCQAPANSCAQRACVCQDNTDYLGSLSVATGHVTQSIMATDTHIYLVDQCAKIYRTPLTSSGADEALGVLHDDASCTSNDKLWPGAPGTLYAAGQRTLYRFDLTTKMSTVIDTYPGAGRVDSQVLASDNQSVLWRAGDALRRLDLQSMTGTTLIDDMEGGSFALDTSHVYWAKGPTTLRRFPRSGGDIETFQLTSPEIELSDHLVVDGGFVYWENGCGMASCQGLFRSGPAGAFLTANWYGRRGHDKGEHGLYSVRLPVGCRPKEPGVAYFIMALAWLD